MFQEYNTALRLVGNSSFPGASVHPWPCVDGEEGPSKSSAEFKDWVSTTTTTTTTRRSEGQMDSPANVTITVDRVSHTSHCLASELLMAGILFAVSAVSHHHQRRSDVGGTTGVDEATDLA